MFVPNVKRLKRLTKMYNATGLVEKEHGYTGLLRKHTTTFPETPFVVTFLHNYAEQHAIILQGRSSTVYQTRL